MPLRSLRFAFRPHGRIAHASTWRWYRAQNSLRGLAFVARILKKPWIDQDIRRTRDGVLVCCHWVRQDKWYLDGVRIYAQIEHMTWDTVRRLTSPGGFKVTSLQQHFAYVQRKRFHIGLKIEPKNPYTFTTAAQVEQVVGWSRRYDVKVSSYILRANNSDGQAALLTKHGIPCTVLKK